VTEQIMTFDKIRKRLGLKRGYGSVIENWNDQEKELIENFIADGLEMFYNQSSYEWSFMTPVEDLTIVEGTTELALPLSFGFLAGDIYFASSSGASMPMELMNPPKVMMQRQLDSTRTGRPQVCAIDERAPSQTHGQRKYLIFWPEADDDYDIQLRFSVLPEMLSTNNQYPWGAAAHGQTILQACMAKSEQFDEVMGLQTNLYMISLEASKNYDRRVKAQTIGYSGDGRKFSGYPQQQNVTYTSNL
jgi:hypothetical protein